MSTTADDAKKRQEETQKKSLGLEIEAEKRIKQYELETLAIINNAVMLGIAQASNEAANPNLTAAKRLEAQQNVKKIQTVFLEVMAKRTPNRPNTVINEEFNKLKADGRTKIELEFDEIFSVIFAELLGKQVEPKLNRIQNRLFPNTSSYATILAVLNKTLNAPKLTERAFREGFAKIIPCLVSLDSKLCIEIINLFLACKMKHSFSLDSISDPNYNMSIFGEAILLKKWDVVMHLISNKLISITESDHRNIWGGPTVRLGVLILPLDDEKTTLDHEIDANLLQACRDGDINQIKFCLAFDANPNYANARGETPLIQAKNANVVDALISHHPTNRASVNYIYRDTARRLSPLPLAVLEVEKTGLDKVRVLLWPEEISKETLEMGLMEILSIVDKGPLAVAVFKEFLFRIGKNSFSLETRGGRKIYNPFNATFLGALLTRLLYNNTKIVDESIRMLIEIAVEKGASVDCTDLSGHNPLSFAIANIEKVGVSVLKTLLKSKSIPKRLLIETHLTLKKIPDLKKRGELEEAFAPRMKTVTRQEYLLVSFMPRHEQGVQTLYKQYFEKLRSKPNQNSRKNVYTESNKGLSTGSASVNLNNLKKDKEDKDSQEQMKTQSTKDINATLIEKKRLEDEKLAAKLKAEFQEDLLKLCKIAQNGGRKELQEFLPAFKAKYKEKANIHAYYNKVAAIHYSAQKGDVEAVLYLESQSNATEPHSIHLPTQLQQGTTPLQYLKLAGKLDLYHKRKAEIGSERAKTESVQLSTPPSIVKTMKL